MKKCPYCAEEIQANAVKCKHCGEWINKTSFISKLQFFSIPFRIFKKIIPSSEMSKKYFSMILTKIIRGIVLFIGLIVVAMLWELSKLALPVSGMGGGVRGALGFGAMYLIWKKVLPKITIGSQMSKANEDFKDQPKPEPPKPVALTKNEKEKVEKNIRKNKIVIGIIIIILFLVMIISLIDIDSFSSKNESLFSLTDEERDSIMVDVWNSDIIYDSNDFQYRIEIDNDGNNVYDLIEEKVKCYFPNVPTVNKIQHNAADFRVYQDQDTLTSLISTLNIAEFDWSENDYNAIYSVKDMFLKNSVNEYIKQLYGGYDYNIEIMEKIKFHQKHDGYAYQLSLSDEYCHKGVLFLIKNKIYHINVKGICEAKPLINYTYSLMHHTLEVK